jgi:levanbiose-producing levanase
MGKNVVVLGTQWGDEGKGKIVDLLTDHSTSVDLIHWQDHGVAIDKYKNGLGDIETGSAVIDTKNTAGFGAGAIIAILTQQHEGVQRQSLFVSTDGGYRFKAYDGNPVMDNPGVHDWRDPKIIWDDKHNEWLMALAEGNKIGFYTSSDLKHWTYRSGFERNDLGLLECPDLFLYIKYHFQYLQLRSYFQLFQK